jgi:hypothetical protein
MVHSKPSTTDLEGDSYTNVKITASWRLKSAEVFPKGTILATLPKKVKNTHPEGALERVIRGIIRQNLVIHPGRRPEQRKDGP